MEQIGSIVKRNPIDQLASKSSDTTAISTRSSEPMQLLRASGAAEWQVKLFQMAQDKRHDLPAETVAWWKEKLKAFSDEEICESLMLWSGEFFPSVDEIVNTLRRKRLDAATNRPWQEYKAAQEAAEREGRMGTQEDKDKLRETFRKVAEEATPFTHKGRTPPPLEELSNEELVKSVQAAKKAIETDPEVKSIYKQMKRDSARLTRDRESLYKG